MRLSEHQKKIIDEALSKKENGDFKYSTVIYSAPKKSGKSAITSAVILYMAYHNPNSFLACIANDGKQSADRLYLPIYTCFRLHRELGGIFSEVKPKLESVILPNYAKIEAVTVDAAGEAGSQPLMVAFCFDEETEILTKEGWKRYDQYSLDDEFVTLNEEGYLEYQRPSHINITEYNGPMHLLESRRYSLCVTPNHRLYGKFNGKLTKFEKRTVEETRQLSSYHLRVETRGILQKEENVPEYVIIPATKRRPEYKIPIKLYLKLLGWYLSEGCTHKGDTIMLAQSQKSEYFQEIWDLVTEMGYTPHVWKGTDAIVFYDTRLAKHFKQFGLAHEKFIPKWIKELPKEYLDIMLDTYWKGDGYKAGPAYLKGGSLIYATNSPQLRDDLMELAVLQGSYVSVTTYQDKRWGLPLYTVNVKKRIDGERSVGATKKKWKTIPYSGTIHCPTVPNGVVIVRRHGKVHAQGQSELWGFDTESKKRMFSELTLPPTLYGKAIRWIETYAGYKGKSELLEQIYETGYINGMPHPDFDLVGRDGPVVKYNPAASMFVYWDTEPRMIWQSKEYYVQEAAILSPSEFRRIHRNEWVSAMNSFIESSWWDACEDNAIPLLKDGSDTPVVVGIDMAVTGDCAALVAVTRHPFLPDTNIAVRAVRIFNPAHSSGIIDQEKLIRPVLEEWFNRYNVICWVYDPHEMAKLAQDMARAGLGWFKPFGQQNPRTIADKLLYDMIVTKHIAWNRHTTQGDVGYRGDSQETLYRHMTQAGAKVFGSTYRLEKLSNRTHIDGAVALSQATFQCMKLIIGNSEFDEKHLIRKLQYGLMSVDEFSEQMRQSHPELVARAVQDYLKEKQNG